MNYRPFGKTDLITSEIGFGAWAIGGPAQVGLTQIGWGAADDAVSQQALHRALDLGITFYDTADFYGLGHSETLLGRTFGNRPDVLLASKVGQRAEAGRIVVDYAKAHVIAACEASLRRLRREAIDFYQLHVAKREHLEAGDCLAVLTELQQAGKIRHWGISLNTFAPEPEAEFMLEHQLGAGFQVVFNVLNQRIRPYLAPMQQQGAGVIARMPLQFGLLARKFSPATTFAPDDHRRTRLTPEVIAAADQALQPVWTLAQRLGLTPAELSLSYILAHPEISVVIPGIRTPAQAEQNTKPLPRLAEADRDYLTSLYEERFQPLLALLKQQG